jgi:hypothetical protein
VAREYLNVIPDYFYPHEIKQSVLC